MYFAGIKLAGVYGEQFMASNFTQAFKKSASPSRVITPARDVALVLAGCGHRDGAEITEAVSLLIQLSSAGMRTKIFAPNRDQAGAINHLSGESLPERRSILEEAARIARGDVRPLEQCHAGDFDALVFAGGFGVARNLCNFASAGVEARLEKDVKVLLHDFMSQGRVVGALCIAPVLLALYGKELGRRGMSLTLGDGSAKSAVEAIESWGATHVPCAVREACVDPLNRLVSAPAYMDGQASPVDIFASAAALVDGMRELFDRAHV